MNILNEIIEKSSPIEQITSIDSRTLKKEYINKEQPILIKGYAKNWNATKNWDLDFLLNLKEDKEVRYLSENYIHDGSSYKKTTFKEHILKLKEAEKDNNDCKQYLAALNLFNLFPYLEKDVDFSIFTSFTKKNIVSAWIGPKGTISGFHSDTAKNMYAQIMGKKLFILASPKFNKEMYPSDKFVNGGVASEIDINAFVENKFPLFNEVKFITAFLDPGDVLHVPSNWWHYVQSLDTSISISNFGYNAFEIYSLLGFERLKVSLHKRGYYKKNNCFCC